MIPIHIEIITQVLLPSTDRFVNAKPTNDIIPHVDKKNITNVPSNAFTTLIQNELLFSPKNLPPFFICTFSTRVHQPNYHLSLIRAWTHGLCVRFRITSREFPKSGYYLHIYLRFWEFTVRIIGS